MLIKKFKGMKLWYGWPMLAVMWFIVFLNVGFPQYGASVANTAMINELDFDRTIYGYAFTLYTLFNGLLGPVVGKLITKKGARFTYYIGTVLIFCGAVLLGFCMNNVYTFVLAYGVILGNAVLFGTSVPMHVTITNWFEKKRGLALGIGATAAAVGTFIASPLMAQIATNFGWEACWKTVMFTSLLAMVVLVLFFVNKPEEIGQEIDGYLKKSSASEVEDAVEEKAVSSRVYRTTEDWTGKEALLQPKTWLLFVGMCGYFMLYVLIMSTSMLYLTDIGFDLTIAATSFSIIAISSLAGRLGCGFLADYVDPRFIWVGTSLLLVLGVVILINCDSAIMMYGYSICAGVGFGGSFTMVPAVFSNFYGRKAFAEIKATLELPLNIVSCFGPSVAGIIYASVGSYVPAYIAYIAFGVVAILFILVAKPPKRKAS